MTDPHQNNSPTPGRWTEGNHASAFPGTTPAPASGPSSSPTPGFPQDPNQGFPPQGSVPPYGSAQPAANSNGTKVSIIIIAVMVVLTVIITALYFAIGDDKDDDSKAAAAQSSASQSSDPGSSFGGDTLIDDSTMESLDPRWAALLPSSLVSHLDGCSDNSFEIEMVDEPGTAYDVDGSRCVLVNTTSMMSNLVDILEQRERSDYLLSVLNGEYPPATGEIFHQDGEITVGVSDVEASFGTTLYYIDAKTGLAVEITGFVNADSARDIAKEIGIL